MLLRAWHKMDKERMYETIRLQMECLARPEVAQGPLSLALISSRTAAGSFSNER